MSGKFETPAQSADAPQTGCALPSSIVDDTWSRDASGTGCAKVQETAPSPAQAGTDSVESGIADSAQQTTPEQKKIEDTFGTVEFFQGANKDTDCATTKACGPALAVSEILRKAGVEILSKQPPLTVDELRKRFEKKSLAN